MESEVMADSFLAYNEELNIFQRPIQFVGIQGRQVSTCYPINDYTSQGIISFSIPAHGSAYIDLKNIKLNITCKIVKKDGGKMVSPTENKGSCGPVCNTLHSIWSRVDVSLQGKLLTHSDNNYPYLAYLKALLNTTNAQENTLQAQLFYPDKAGSFDSTEWYVSDNPAFKTRSQFFDCSQEVDMSGNLACDVLDINRYIPNGVSLDVKLYPANPEFFLMSKDADIATTGGYRMVITKASLEVPKVHLSPEIVIAHSQVLDANNKAIFPFMSSEIKCHNVQKGAYDCEINNPFSGRVPSEILITMVKDTARNGSYGNNPFNFSHVNLSSINFTVDSQDVGGGTIKTNYGDKAYKSNYIEAYKTLIGVNGQDCSIPITRLEYPEGYCLYRYVVSAEGSDGSDDVISLKRSGNVRLYMTFKKALIESYTVILWAKFPSALELDKSRAIRVL